MIRAKQSRSPAIATLLLVSALLAGASLALSAEPAQAKCRWSARFTISGPGIAFPLQVRLHGIGQEDLIGEPLRSTPRGEEQWLGAGYILRNDCGAFDYHPSFRGRAVVRYRNSGRWYAPSHELVQALQVQIPQAQLVSRLRASGAL